MAERFCFDGVVEEWDRTDSIRERVRCGQFLEDDSQGSDANNKAAALNSEVIVPLLVRMAACNLQLPSVEHLRVAVADLYHRNQREVSESRVDDSAWFCRHAVVHVKRKAQKKLVSLDSRLNLGFSGGGALPLNSVGHICNEIELS